MGIAQDHATVERTSRLDVMNFLNEIAGDYPDAISFASGRPAEAFFDMARWLQRIPEFVAHFARERDVDETTAFNLLAQYGRTNGVVNALIARQVGIDEGIECNAGQVVVTTGCQEAIDLCVTSLCTQPGDVVLVRSPTYIGITGVAELAGIAMEPFCCDTPEYFADALAEACTRVVASGRRPTVLYLTADFDNPTGTVLSRATREQVIAICAARGIVVLEDNPYGMFRYQGERVPTMHALDRHGCVVYLGTYSKTLCPSVRVGFAIVPTTLFGDAGRARALVDVVSRAKSFVTVNTSQITQAMLGGVLLAEGGSLARTIQPVLEHYRRNRDRMLECLEHAFEGYRDRISWNVPAGGFFLTIELPFAFKQAEAEICARDYGVLTMPLSFFALNDAHDHWVRLAFSNVAPERIGDGIERFARFVKQRLAAQQPA